MGRYNQYFNDIWKLQANRKVLGLSLFGTIIDNSRPFTPGDPIVPIDGVDQAISILSQKGYDLLIITGQPSQRTKNLEIHDFENILNGTKEFVSSIGGRVKFAYYAPGIDKNDPYVKPNPGMFEKAQNEGMVNWTNSMYIGTDINDVKAATKVKAEPILIKTNKEIKTKAFELTNQVKIKEFNSLLDFANSI